MKVDELINEISNETDPQRIVDLWTSVYDLRKQNSLSLADILVIHEECGSAIVYAAKSIEDKKEKNT